MSGFCVHVCNTVHRKKLNSPFNTEATELFSTLDPVGLSCFMFHVALKKAPTHLLPRGLC